MVLAFMIPRGKITNLMQPNKIFISFSYHYYYNFIKFDFSPILSVRPTAPAGKRPSQPRPQRKTPSTPTDRQAPLPTMKQASHPSPAAQTDRRRSAGPGKQVTNRETTHHTRTAPHRAQPHEHQLGRSMPSIGTKGKNKK